MNIKPLYDRILVKIKSPEETTKGGIIIPDAAEAENKPQEGTVVGTGDGMLLQDGTTKPLDIKEFVLGNNQFQLNSMIDND